VRRIKAEATKLLGGDLWEDTLRMGVKSLSGQQIGEEALRLGIRSVDALADALSGRSRAEYDRAVAKIREQEDVMRLQSLAEQARTRSDSERAGQARCFVAASAGRAPSQATPVCDVRVPVGRG
jgi:hypothetical protein